MFKVTDCDRIFEVTTCDLKRGSELLWEPVADCDWLFEVANCDLKIMFICGCLEGECVAEMYSTDKNSDIRREQYVRSTANFGFSR